MPNEDTEIVAGISVRRQVRGALEGLKMFGQINDFRESKGLIQSRFYVKGASKQAMMAMAGWMDGE